MKKMRTNNLLLKELRDLSFFLGSNIDWIQGAGGNTSVKDNGVLWVKASGYWLSDAEIKNIFIPLDRQMVLDKINLEIEDLSSAQIYESQDKNIRPSIETTLHALMRHKFVVHAHSVNVISYAVLKNGKEAISQKLQGMNWLWVPYVRPGLPLTMMLKQMNIYDFDVVILANHGLVVGGETKKEVLDLFNQVEIRLNRPVRGNFSKTDNLALSTIIDSSNYKLPKHDLSHSLAKDSLSLQVMIKNALYPDHVIFLGPGSIPIMTHEKFIKESFQKSLNYKVIVIKDIGAVVNQNLSENAEEMLHCFANVLLRLQSNDDLQHLTQNQETELLGWDAEKYRKSIQR